MKIIIRVKGGRGSGFYNHKGRPGIRGGSVQSGQSGIADYDSYLRDRNENRQTNTYYNQFKRVLHTKYTLQELTDAVQNMLDSYPSQKDLEESVRSQMEVNPTTISKADRSIKEVLEGLNPKYLLQDEPLNSDVSNYTHAKNMAIDNIEFQMDSLSIPITPITRKVLVDSFPSKQDLLETPDSTAADVWRNNMYKAYNSLPAKDRSAFNTTIANKAYDIALGREYLNVGTNFEAMDFIISGKLRQAYNWAWDNFGSQWDEKVLPGFNHQFAKALATLAKGNTLGWEASTLRY